MQVTTAVVPCYTCAVVFPDVGVFSSMDVLEVYVNLPNDHLVPVRAHPGDAGLDLYSNSSRQLIEPLERVKIDTGVSVNIPYGYVGEVCSRSGLALNKGLVVLNSPGIIDHGYVGEVSVILANLSNEAVYVDYMDRIAQLLIKKVELPELKVQYKPFKATERGDGGFGSTGV